MEFQFPNLRHMRVFLETARSGSVSVAAQKCHLSQPAATQALAKLEEDTGAPLLFRSRPRFSLTRAGEVFAPRASSALAHLTASSRAALKAAGHNRNPGQKIPLPYSAAQLRTLVAVANTGSFTVAAHRLNVSQPTIHRAARSLEALLGVPLFGARPSGVQLTPAAEALAIGAKLAHSEIQQGKAEISKVLGEDTGTFVLGSLPLARTSIVPKAVHAFISEFSSVQVRIVDGRYDELLRSLREGDIDCLIGALRDPPPAEDVSQDILFSDSLAIVARPGHPLTKRTQIDIEDTLAYPWIAPPKETPAGTFLFETLRIQERSHTPVRAVSSSMVLLRSLLAQGDYVSIVSSHQIQVDAHLGMITTLNVPLKGNSRDIGLTTRSGWRPTETQARFIDFLRLYSPKNGH